MKPFAFLPISHKTPSFFPSIYLLIFIKLSRDLFFYFFWQQFLTTMSRIGLAFSGGGIRSAAFCSGVLRRLLQLKVKIENMSCVSGGGFTGTAYLDWKYRNGQKDNPKWHQEFFNQMRERTGYFCNWQSLVTGLIDTVLVTTIIALVSVILPALIWMTYACPLAYLVDFLVGDLLRATSHAHKHKHNVPDLVYQRNVLFASLWWRAFLVS